MKRNLMSELTEGVNHLANDRQAKDKKAILALIKESQEIEQILGKALGYPWYKDDPKNFPTATEADGVCVAPNTAASLAMHAADKIKMLDIREQDKQKIIDEQREEIAKLKESVEYYIDFLHL